VTTPRDHAATIPAIAESCALSIVIVAWNTRALLEKCLVSVVGASREIAGHTEVIVVDNASSDCTVQMVREQFPGVTVISNAVNVGFAAANNQALRQAAGRYLLLLNPDTEIAPGALGRLAEFLDSHPSAAAVGPRLVGTHGESQVSCFPRPTLAREAWRLFHCDRLVAWASYPQARLNSRIPQQVDTIQGACLLIRKTALAQIGLLDERFFIYTEEVDLCRRIAEAGWQIFWVPEALVLHHGGASTRQVGTPMFLELYRSKVEYFRKHSGPRGVLVYKAVLLAASIARLSLPPFIMAVKPSRRGDCRVVLKNYTALLMRLPAL